MALRFHWMLPKSGEIVATTPVASARHQVESVRDGSPAGTPELDGWLRFATLAEDAGIDSVLISFSRYEPDPLLIACALGRATRSLGFILAVRSGLLSPTLLVQQLNTLSGLLGGRVSLNMVAGSSKMEQRGYGDHLAHDDRYARADEFLAICNALWREPEADLQFDGRHYSIESGRVHTPFCSPTRSRPEVYVSGHSPPAERVAMQRSSCWLRVVDSPDALRELVARTRERGVEVCLRASVVCRPTREQAIEVVESLLADPVVRTPFVGAPVKDDSQMYAESRTATLPSSWPCPWLFTGLAPARGPVWTAMVGTPDELAGAFVELGRIGVTQFILSGWPEHDEVAWFGREVLPRVRAADRG